MEVTRPSLPQDINRSARHTLFVEGEFDVAVLSTFFNSHPPGVELHVEAFGPSSSLRAAADAFHRHHPEYYFLIDRDHHDDETVERSWRNFPDRTTSNILIWRRRELENYFLIPEYLLRSEHLCVGETELRTCIRDACARRLYFDAANYVITGLRESFKSNWIKHFDRPDDFPDRDAALARLCALQQLTERSDAFSAAIAPDALRCELDDVLAQMTASYPTLADGHGLWRARPRQESPPDRHQFLLPDPQSGRSLPARRREAPRGRARSRQTPAGRSARRLASLTRSTRRASPASPCVTARVLSGHAHAGPHTAPPAT